jgi:Trk K+ transport system NAD-binding subunit
MRLPKNTNVVSILRGGVALVPDGSTAILPGDAITVLCLSSQRQAVRRFFGSRA